MVAAGLVTSLSHAAGQPATGFEVASIKPSRSGSIESNLDSAPGGRLTATNITVRELIRLAFGVKDYQIKRAPGWVDSERYDILAKSVNVNKTSYEEEQSQVRELLAERFQLKTHRETKEGQVYLLVVGKDGSKLTRNDGTGARTRKGCGHLEGARLTMDVIATVLSRQFESDVLNRTALPGKYDFQFDWTPETGPCPASSDGPATAPAVSRPSIFTALQEQLGLKLEASKGPVQILSIDHVERPSQN